MANNNFLFRINGTREIELAYREPDSISPNLKTDTPPELGMNLNYRWDIDNNIFVVIVSIIFKCKNIEDKDIIVLKFTNITEYEIKDLNKHFKDLGNGKFEMNQEIETTVVSVAISGARGMLAGRSAGTYWGKFVIPLIIPSDVILSKKLNPEKENKV